MGKQWLTLFWGAPKSLQMVTAAMKLRHLLLGKKVMTNLDSKLKSRDFEEEKLKLYITSCSFCLCNSACSLQSLDHVGHVVSESGDILTMLGTGAYLIHPCPALCNYPAPANLLNHACLCKGQASPSPSRLWFPRAQNPLV